MRLKIGFLALAVFAIACQVGAQRSISGVLTDESGSPASYVQVSSGNISTYSDDYGRFDLLVPENLIRITSLLYKDTTLNTDTWLNGANVVLAASELPVALVVAPERSGIGKYYLKPEQIASIPSIGGEVDVLRSLQSLPAIAGGAEGSVRPRIRGSEANASLITLDGAPVLSPTTFFGFQGAINYESVRDVTAYTGIVPAEFGGRSGGVIDITTKAGSDTRHSKKVSAGFPNIGVTVDGPISNKATYFGAGRGTYLALPLAFTDNRLYQGDILASVALRESHWVHTLKYYSNVSNYLIRGDGQSEVQSTTRDESGGYGNSLLISSSSYSRNRFRFDASAHSSTYRSSAGLKETLGESEVTVDDIAEARVRSMAIRSRAAIEHDLGELSAGIEAEHLRLSNGISSLDIDSTFEFSSNSTQLSAAVLAQLDLSVAGFDFRLGARAPFFADEAFKLLDNLEPRLQASYSLNPQIAFGAGYGRNLQYVHVFGSPTSVGAFDTYALASALYPRSFTDQAVGNIKLFIAKWDLDIQFSGFYKSMQNLVMLVNSELAVFNSDLRSSSRSVIKGNGQASGLETLISWRNDQFELRTAYAYARSFRRFESLNRGNWFPFRWERPHRLSVVGAWHPKKLRWSFSTQAIYESGYPFTAPIGTTFTRFAANPFFDQQDPLLVYTSVNNIRSIPMIRLDLGAIYEKSYENGKALSWRFSLYNATYRTNPSASFVETNTRFTSDLESRIQQTTITTRTLFRAIPGVQFSYKW